MAKFGVWLVAALTLTPLTLAGPLLRRLATPTPTIWR